MRLLVKIALCLLLSIPSWGYTDVLKLETQTSLRDVYLIQDDDADLITVAMVIMAGEVNVDGPEGLSHYLEHLMFWHADDVKGESIHSRDGNAWVNGIVTSYYNRGESSELEDMLEFARRILTPPKLALNFMTGERDVVSREYDLRVSENPDWRVLTDLRKKLYDNHPVSRSVIGSRKSIASLTVEQATAFHQAFYHSANSILIVSGDIEAQDITELIQSRFAGIPDSRQSRNKSDSQFWRQHSVKGRIDDANEYVEKQAKSSRLIYTSLSDWSSEQDRTQGYYTQQFTERLLVSALEGSLAKPLRLDNFIVSGYELFVYNHLNEQIELNIIAWPDDGISIEYAAESVTAALKQLGLEGVPQKTFDRIKKRWLQTAKRENSNVDNLLWRTWVHVSSGLEPNTKSDHLERIASVTISDVNSLIAALGNPQRRTIGLIKGE